MKSANIGKAFAVIALSLSLVACGGGGGSSPAAVASTPTPPVVVTPPVVTPPDPVIPVTPEILPAIKVQATSYLNAKASNIGSQALPIVDPTNVEKITNGFAYADFTRNGRQALVGFSEYIPADGSANTKVGKAYFFTKATDGKWVNKTAEMLDDTTGCITPRKILIADFNNDGRPDVFASCHGQDFGTFPGETQRVLLSQADGKYKNVDLLHTAFAHGASAADVDGDGNVDILLANMKGQGGKTPLYFLMGDGKGNFIPDYTRAYRQDLAYTKGYWTVELIANSTGNFDILAGGTESNGSNTVLIKGVNGKFDGVMNILPAVSNYGTVLDFVVDGENAYVLRTTTSPEYNGSAIQKINLTTNASSLIYEHNGEYPGKYSSFATKWLNWITIHNDKIVSVDAFFNVSVTK